MKKNNKKGFTLAELLIVVAIIAVLVAIAIPIFTTQLEKSREATDVANARDYYAEIAAAIVTGDLSYTTADTMKVSGGLDATSTALSGTTFTVSVAGTKVNQTVYSAWSIAAPNIAGVQLTDANAPASASATTITYTFTVTDDNAYLSGVAWGA